MSLYIYLFLVTYDFSSSQALEIFCTDIQGSITGALIFTIPNGHLYCTALLKATCCFQPPSVSPPSLSSSSPPVHRQSPATLVKPSTPSTSTRVTKTHGEPSSGSSHVATRRTADGNSSACSSDGAVSPQNHPESGPFECCHSRHGSGTGLSSKPWKGAAGGTGAGSNFSPFRPPQSQGIPITGSRRAIGRMSSNRTNSLGGSVHATPFSTPGSFLQSAAVLGSQQSSLNSWSIWNPESLDSRLGREFWGEGHSSVTHSLRSWVFVNESELSGMCV